jgi:ABC-type nitrate/sulfonate/bicarbonate transport system substrate-binding protein/LysM repeat protein
MQYLIKKARVKSLAALLAALAVVAPSLPGNLLAADRPMQKVNVAYSSISGNIAALWVTQDKGFFRKYGMEIQAVLIESGTTTAQALVAGDIAFANVAGPPVIQSGLRGADLVIIAGVINTLVFQLYTDKNISRPDQLKGKSVGVTRFGSATDFAIRYALEKYGLDPNKDVAVLQLGNQTAQLAALEAGRVQGAMLSMPTSLRAKKGGFPMLADLQMLGLEYQHTSLATSRALLKAKPELARDFLRAYIEGIHYAKTHRKETIDVLAKYLRVDDKEVLDETYDTLVTTLMPEKPYPTIKGVQTILREFGTKDPAARAARPEQFVDSSLVKELDSSGFIDHLYKPAVAVAKSAPVKEAAAAAPTLAVSKERPVQVAESKTKPVATEEKAKPVAKQVPAVSEKAPAPPATKSAGQQYTVKAGDTLSKLAEQFYSATGKWEKIYQANRESLKNPNYIYVGMKLMIPADDKPS